MLDQLLYAAAMLSLSALFFASLIAFVGVAMFLIKTSTAALYNSQVTKTFLTKARRRLSLLGRRT